MKELVKHEVFFPEVINAVGNVLKELPYDKLALIGVGYLAYTALKECNIKAQFKDFSVEINPT